MSEFHLTTRVTDLERAVDYYSWLFGVAPKTKFDGRYAVFLVPERHLNMVMIQNEVGGDGPDRVHHIGLGVEGREAVLDFQTRARARGYPVADPAKTTWRGTAMHQLWLEDPDGVKVEIYARLTDDELAAMPADQTPVVLT